MKFENKEVLIYDREENPTIGSIPLSQALRLDGFNQENFKIISMENTEYVKADIYFVAFNTHKTADALEIFNKYKSKITEKNKIIKITSSHGCGFSYIIT